MTSAKAIATTSPSLSDGMSRWGNRPCPKVAKNAMEANACPAGDTCLTIVPRSGSRTHHPSYKRRSPYLGFTVEPSLLLSVVTEGGGHPPCLSPTAPSGGYQSPFGMVVRSHSLSLQHRRPEGLVRKIAPEVQPPPLRCSDILTGRIPTYQCFGFLNESKP